ncbi:hypothetical protein SLE2022_195430 [Rubroshorea leprosula]
MREMTLLWGKTTGDIFPGVPGQTFHCYVFGLTLVFSISLVVEWLSHTRIIKSKSADNVTAGLLQTVMYGIRVALAYLVMLAVMSFNVGVMVAAVAGYSVGFLIFGSRALVKSQIVPYEESPDLPPLNC